MLLATQLRSARGIDYLRQSSKKNKNLHQSPKEHQIQVQDLTSSLEQENRTIYPNMQ